MSNDEGMTNANDQIKERSDFVIKAYGLPSSFVIRHFNSPTCRRRK